MAAILVAYRYQHEEIVNLRLLCRNRSGRSFHQTRSILCLQAAAPCQFPLLAIATECSKHLPLPC